MISFIDPVAETPLKQSDYAFVPDGERKMVTELFADIRGSTELMEDLDLEEARAIVDPALKAMIDAVLSLRGTYRAVDGRWCLRAVRRSHGT